MIAMIKNVTKIKCIKYVVVVKFIHTVIFIHHHNNLSSISIKDNWIYF